MLQLKKTQHSRDVSQPDRLGFVTREGLGLSPSLRPISQTPEPQSSLYKPSKVTRTKYETVTAGMAAEFVSSVVDLCCEQLS